MVKTLVDLEMVSVPCADCGIVFALPKNYDQKLRESHKGFYCPNGHTLTYPYETEAERLKTKLITAQDRCSHLETELNGTLKRLACIHKRIHAGICPECHRHFLNVERHMTKKHPVKAL